MATSLEAATANAGCDAIVDLIDAGAGAGTILWTTAADGTLATTTCSDPAFGAAAAGVATLQGTPLDSSSVAAGGGTCTKAKWRDSDTTLRWTDVVATSGGDINLSTNVLAENDIIRLTSYTFTVAGA